MRTESDLVDAFDELEQRADAYLATTAATTSRPAGRAVVLDLERHPVRVARRASTTRRAAVAAISVGLLAVGATVLRSATAPDSTAGGGIAACIAPLPGAWRAALDSAPVRAPGGATLDPAGITPSGNVLASWSTRASVHLDVVSRAGRVTELYRHRLVPHELVTQVRTDATYAVVGTSIGHHGNRIVLVDLATGKTRQLLAHAPLAHSAQIGPGAWIVVMNGSVYWPAAGRTWSVIGYDIATHRYTSRRTPDEAVYATPDGISWSTGSIARAGLPPVHPAIGDAKLTLATDGQHLAWSEYADPSHVSWSEQSGASRSVVQHVMHFLSVGAVSGPYVFLTSGEGDDSDKVDGDLQVLDTRTGALADTGLQSWDQGVARNGLLALTANDPKKSMKVLDTSNLPRITCP